MQTDLDLKVSILSFINKHMNFSSFLWLQIVDSLLVITKTVEQLFIVSELVK